MAGALTEAYARLPLALQNAAISAYGFRWQRRRFGGAFEHALKAFKEREGWTASAWRAYQTTELRRLLVHAFETVPYYRRVYSAAGFTASALSRFELEDLSRLPMLEKQDLRKYGRSDLLSASREKGGTFFASSGSTGTPTSILFSHPFHQRWSAAFEARIRHWAGVDRHQPRGMIGGRRVVPGANARPPYYRFNRFEHQVYFSAYHISPSTAADYVDGMRRHGVTYMTGYAMSNALLAAMIRDAALEAPRMRAVITSSEKLTPEMRALFSQVYGCRTFDSYSGVEACGLISENEAGELMFSPDTGVMEVLGEDGKQVANGHKGEVIATGLLNVDQPLIRYRIGDEVSLAATQSSVTGREMPIVQEIFGRIEDTIVGPDGRAMVRFHGVFVDVPHLVAAQVVQERIDAIAIRVIVERGFSSASEAMMAARVRSQLCDVHVRVDRVDELERGANGKIPAVISHVQPGARR